MADDIARLSEELARDPASGVFIPLADALRRRGQLDLARKIATRGLTRRPYDGDAHDLLARIWADMGDVQRAMDEWSMALQCAPGHANALKGMGFAYHQVGNTADAERCLMQAAAADPEDLSIRAALARVRHQRAAASVSPPASPSPSSAITVDADPSAGPSAAHAAPRAESPDARETAPARGAPARGAAPAEGALDTVPDPARADAAPADAAPADAAPADATLAHVAPAEAGPADDAPPDARDQSSISPPRDDRLPSGGDPRVAFVDILDGDQAALVVDGQGLVMAGSYVIADGRDVAQDVGAALSGVSDEARRAMRHLDLGAWSSLMFETDTALVAMAPLPPDRGARSANGAGRAIQPASDGIALVAAGPSVPLGLVRWLLARVVGRAVTWLGESQRGGAQ